MGYPLPPGQDGYPLARTGWGTSDRMGYPPPPFPHRQVRLGQVTLRVVRLLQLPQEDFLVLTWQLRTHPHTLKGQRNIRSAEFTTFFSRKGKIKHIQASLLM